jgi:hypothetical protein
MTYALILLPIYLVLIVFYMVARLRNNLKMNVVIQSAITFLAIVIAALNFFSPHASTSYANTYTLFSGFQLQDLFIGALALLPYLLFLRLYWKGLGNLRIPVLVFMLAVTFMLTRAVSTFFGTGFFILSAWLAAIGAALVFLSDVEYRLRRFHKPLNFSHGPIFYSSGQLLIALVH